MLFAATGNSNWFTTFHSSPVGSFAAQSGWMYRKRESIAAVSPIILVLRFINILFGKSSIFYKISLRIINPVQGLFLVDRHQDNSRCKLNYQAMKQYHQLPLSMKNQKNSFVFPAIVTLTHPMM